MNFTGISVQHWTLIFFFLFLLLLFFMDVEEVTVVFQLMVLFFLNVHRLLSICHSLVNDVIRQQ